MTKIKIIFVVFQKIPVMLQKFYHTKYIYKFIHDLQNKNIDFVEVSTIGHTKQGTPLKIIKIKTDHNNDIIWIDGGTLYFYKII